MDFINSVLASAHSPAAGKGQTLYNDGVRFGVDPAFALAFFMYESSFGTQGLAQITHSLGALQTPITPTCNCQPCLGLRQYHFWEDGFVDWYNLIRNQYVNQWNLSTVDQIVPVYASAGGDKEIKSFIRAVKSTINAWRNGQQPPLITEKHMFPAYTAGNENGHSELTIQLLERIAEMKRNE